MAVPRQEFAGAKRPGAVRRSDDDDVAEVAGNQSQAAHDERPHQDLAQLGVGLDQGEQFVAIELDHLARLAHLQACDRAPAGNHVGFAGEVPGSMPHNQRVGTLAGADRLDLAGHDDEERNGPAAHLDEHLAARGRPPASVRGNAGDLLLGERRERALTTGDGVGLSRSRAIWRVHAEFSVAQERVTSTTAFAKASGASCGRLWPTPPLTRR